MPKKSFHLASADYQRYCQYLRILETIIVVLDRQGRVKFVNQKGCKVLGRAQKNIVGKSWFQTFLPERIRREAKEVFHKLMKGKLHGSEYFENPVVNSKGEERIVRWRNTFIKNAKGKVEETLSSGEDITEQRQAEQQLKDTKEKLEYLLGVTKTGVDVIDSSFNLQYVDPAWQKIYGKPNGQKCYRYFMGRKTSCAGCGIPRALRTRKITITEEVLPRENNRIIEVHTIPFRDPKGKWMVAEFNVDITERKRMEKTLRENRHQLLQIIDTVPHMIFAEDKEGRFLLVNSAVAEAYGKTPRDLIGIRWKDIHKVPEEFDRYLEIDKEILATGRPRIISNDVFTDFRGKRHILQTIKIPFHMTGQKEMCILGVSVDVTEQKRIEEFRNDIVRTVSHELRTPLSIQKEGIDLILDGFLGPINPKQKVILETVMRSVNRLSRMIASLLDISRIETGKIELQKGPTALDILLRDVAFEFKRKAEEKGIELRVKLPEDSIRIFADADKITQVVTNLVDNAIKFTEKGTVEISAKVSEGKVKCTVCDTGIGIAKKNITKMFEKFQQFSRTAGAGEKGLGLGLPIAKGIVEMHGGRIWVRSEHGKGTQITFTLPFCNAGSKKRANLCTQKSLKK